jgi:hypothetical protein
VCQSHTGRLNGFWFLLNQPKGWILMNQGLNTNEWIYIYIYIYICPGSGHEVAQLVEALRYKPEGRGFRSLWFYWNFLLTYTFWPHHGPGVDSASNRNEYQEYCWLGLTQPLTEMSTRNISWWVKAAGAWGWQTYLFYVPTVLKSGSLILLKTSGLVQACNGFALLLPYLSGNDPIFRSFRTPLGRLLQEMC